VTTEDRPRVYTIGHSNHSLEVFLLLLESNEIELVVDVRSQPYSRYASHFNGPELKTSIAGSGIRYLFLGKQIGGRPECEEYYDDQGYVLYDRLAASPLFLEGISRLEDEVRRHRTALMCGEEYPSDCHRRLLIGRVLAERGVEVIHMRGDGSLQSEAELAEEKSRGSKDPAQMSLFDFPLFELPVEEKPWRSTRSVSPREQRPPSSEP